MPLRTTFPRGRLHCVRTFSSRPIRRWPCLIRRSRAVEAGVVAAAAGVRAEAAQEAAVKAAPGEAEEQEAPGAVAEEVALAAEGPMLALTTTTPPTVSRGQSCRRFRLRLRPTSRSWLRWRKEQAVSRFSIPTTCWVDSNASGESKANFTSWGTCRRIRRKAVATLSR